MVSAAAIGLGLLLSWWLSKAGIPCWVSQPHSRCTIRFLVTCPIFLVGMVAAVLSYRGSLWPWLKPCPLGVGQCSRHVRVHGATAFGRGQNWARPLIAPYLGSCPCAQVGFFWARPWTPHPPHIPTRLLTTRAWLYSGATSYCLYLIQLTEPVQWFFGLFKGHEMGITHMLWRAFWLYVLTIFISAALYELVERPVQRWLLSAYHPFRRPSD
ncbi:MAG: hypothetical protein IPL28_22780 [Chloroflexi bacterium]|nr:hypothetical protein [Chloroflexota bacterium]